MTEWDEVVPLASASDNNHLWIWIVLIVLGLIGLSTILFMRHRRLAGDGSMDK